MADDVRTVGKLEFDCARALGKDGGGRDRIRLALGRVAEGRDLAIARHQLLVELHDGLGGVTPALDKCGGVRVEIALDPAGDHRA